MEEMIAKVAQKAIKEAVIKNLTDYASPFNKFVKDCVSKREADFKRLIDGEMEALIEAEDFRMAIKEALHKKLAQTLVHKLGGEYEKMVNRLKQDTTTRAKITLAIDNVINEVAGI